MTYEEWLEQEEEPLKKECPLVKEKASIFHLEKNNLRETELANEKIDLGRASTTGHWLWLSW